MIAEFMLHRTKANQVEPVYINFIKNYTSINILANSSVNEITPFLKSLGLNWRSKHFIESAKFIMKNYNGSFPQTRAKLLEIPGIGDYVAGAILTVCFNLPEYVVDSNIARFINRFFNLKLTGEIRRKKVIIEYSKKLFSTRNPCEFLYALLDFTAEICKPTKPICKMCPLNDICSIQ